MFILLIRLGNKFIVGPMVAVLLIGMFAMFSVMLVLELHWACYSDNHSVRTNIVDYYSKTTRCRLAYTCLMQIYLYKAESNFIMLVVCRIKVGDKINFGTFHQTPGFKPRVDLHIACSEHAHALFGRASKEYKSLHDY